MTAGIQKKSDYIQKKFIDEMLGTDGFVEIKAEDLKQEEYEVVEEIEVIEEEMIHETDWRKNMKIEMTDEDYKRKLPK